MLPSTLFKMENNLICKLNFDEEVEDDFTLAPPPALRTKEEFQTNNEIDMDVCSESSFGSSMGICEQKIYSPRKLSFRYHDSPTNSISPPDKKIRSLRLFDSPNTPKTLYKSSAFNINTPSEEQPPVRNVRNSASRTTSRHRLAFGSSSISSTSCCSRSRLSVNSSFNTISENDSEESSERDSTGCCKNMRANVNPFTPNNILSSRKRGRKPRKSSRSDSSNSSLLNNNLPNSKNNNSSMDDTNSLSEEPCDPLIDPQQQNKVRYSSSESDDEYEDTAEDEEEHPSKRIAIHEVNVSRYNKEFAELNVIGKGVFGSVFLCRHRLDGCLYAIKRSIKPVSGSAIERTAMNEVYAHAVLGAHEHVVRYYSAWAEQGHMVIQNEYCNGSSLANSIENNRRHKNSYTEYQITQLLLHVARGLKYIHSLHLVHLDIKPENIFISFDKFTHSGLINEESTDDGFEDENYLNDPNTTYTYKIGDLGHVTSVVSPKVEEGDCRYMARELLQDDYSSLEKVDIFALGLTLFETASGMELPRNGNQWQDIRDGNLPDIAGFSKEFNDLVRLMIHPDPKMRPGASTLLINPALGNAAEILTSGDTKSNKQLNRELEVAKIRNDQLQLQLNKAHHFIKKISRESPPRINDVPVPVPVYPTMMDTDGDAQMFPRAVISSPSPPSPPRDYPYNTRSHVHQATNPDSNNTSSDSTKFATAILQRSTRFVGRKAARSQSTL